MLKRSLALIALLPTLSHAAIIDCYSGSAKIYHGKGHGVQYTDDFVMFTEEGTNNDVYLFANCVITINNTEDSNHATSKGKK